MYDVYKKEMDLLETIKLRLLQQIDENNNLIKKIDTKISELVKII